MIMIFDHFWKFFAKKVQFYKNCIIWSYSLVGDYFDVWHFVRNSKSLDFFSFQMEDSFSKRKLANANEDRWENARIIIFSRVHSFLRWHFPSALLALLTRLKSFNYRSNGIILAIFQHWMNIKVTIYNYKRFKLIYKPYLS